MAEKKEDPNVKVRRAASEGDLDEVKRLVKAGASIDVALIGATDPKPHQKEVKTWALCNGASPLWGIDHVPPKATSVDKLPDRRF
jgi:hypothetical protein